MALIQKVVFHNRDGVSLSGRLNLPVGQYRGSAVFAHCFTCSKDSLAAVRLAEALAQSGIAVLRFDFTGLGQSDGDFGSSGFGGNLADLEDACAFMGSHYRAPDILIGHSLGGAAVLALAGSVPSVKGVATIGAPAAASHVLHLFAGQEEVIKQKGRAEISIGGRPFAIEASFIEDLQARHSLSHISDLRADLLIMHAPQDDIVSIDNAAQIYGAAKHPKSFVSLDRADHLLRKSHDARFAASMISAWASRLVEVREALPPAKEGEVAVMSSPDGPFAHNISAGPHLLRADEPVSVPGGLESGPAPYDFLLAGLGACTAMTLRMYALRKNWPLEEVMVRLTHEKNHATDSRQQDETQDTSAARLDHMKRIITIHGPLDEAQIARLLEIADKCPVHKSLEAGVHVSTSLG